jgi:osmotically-inducible protein OsmY
VPPPPTVVVERVVVSDAVITQSIKAKLEDSNVMRRSQVTIASTAGFVTLVGTVPDQFARDQILEAARATPGVVKIDNQLRFDISSPSAPARSN